MYEKHNIKRADRLMGNLALNQERGLVYQMVGKWIIGNQKHPVILVDWSDLSAISETIGSSILLNTLDLVNNSV